MKRISATDAKNNFGGLLEDVATFGRIEIARHGRVVAIVLSPRALGAIEAQKHETAQQGGPWGATHMIPPELARSARMLSQPEEFDDD
jgi:prevent-host-death family protein